MALLEVDNLNVTYATKSRPPLQAVRNVTFQVEKGEFIGLVGDSGSGKSLVKKIYCLVTSLANSLRPCDLSAA